jgi:hypothetical protein
MYALWIYRLIVGDSSADCRGFTTLNGDLPINLSHPQGFEGHG